MQNRIDINFDEAGYITAETKATEFVNFINAYVKDVKPADRINGANMGEQNGWTYVKKAFQALTADHTLVHAKVVDYDAFARDIDAATKLLKLKSILKGWVGNMEGTFMLIGIDLMEQAAFVKAALALLAKADSDYKALYEDLNFLYENRAQKAALTMEQNKRIEELTKQVEAAQKTAWFIENSTTFLNIIAVFVYQKIKLTAVATAFADVNGGFFSLDFIFTTHKPEKAALKLEKSTLKPKKGTLKLEKGTLKLEKADFKINTCNLKYEIPILSLSLWALWSVWNNTAGKVEGFS